MTPTNRRFPKHLKSTPKEWRQMKRQQWRVVQNAVDDYVSGSAYAPGGNDLHTVQQLVARIWEDLQGEWIAW